MTWDDDGDDDDNDDDGDDIDLTEMTRWTIVYILTIILNLKTFYNKYINFIVKPLMLIWVGFNIHCSEALMSSL